MRIAAALVILLLCISIASAPLRSQTTANQKPAFEVASIKPDIPPPNPRPGKNYGYRRLPGGRFSATNVSLKMLITYAYQVRDFQIIGGADWVSSDRWNIDAKAEGGTVMSPARPSDPTAPDPILLMVQTLVEQRFQLNMHRETRELATYDLVVGKTGSKIHLSDDQTPPDSSTTATPSASSANRPREPQAQARGDFSISAGANGLILQATAVSVSDFTTALSYQLGRTVVDKTGLKSGLYNFKMQWVPDPAEGGTMLPAATVTADTVSLFTAMQEQLGLSLVSTKGPVEVLVIDSVQKPAVN